MSKKMKKDHARVPSGASRGQTHNFLSTNLPAAILVAALLIFWQAAAMGIDAAYILPSPTQVVVRLWELRGPLFKAHLPATMSVVGIGLLISIILGLGLAVLMDASETAERHFIRLSSRPRRSRRQLWHRFLYSGSDIRSGARCL